MTLVKKILILSSLAVVVGFLAYMTQPVKAADDMQTLINKITELKAQIVVLEQKLLMLQQTQNGTVTISHFAGPTSLQAGQMGTWKVQASSSTNSSLSYAIAWGDEAFAQPNGSDLESRAPFAQNTTFSHTYLRSGTFTITVYVKDSMGNNAQKSTTVTVTNAFAPYPPVIKFINPSFGTVGTTVTLTGTGFLPTGNTIHFGVGGIKNVASYNNGTTLTFRVPSYVSPCDLVVGEYMCGAPVMEITPGSYTVFVSNRQGESNRVTFKVTEQIVLSRPPVISGISGPTVLTPSQMGTWTVNAKSPTNSSLSYSVSWGDETVSPDYYGGLKESPQAFMQSATFSHAYYSPGTYTIKVTVKDQAGNTAHTSISVFVEENQWYYPQ